MILFTTAGNEGITPGRYLPTPVPTKGPARTTERNDKLTSIYNFYNEYEKILQYAVGYRYLQDNLNLI